MVKVWQDAAHSEQLAELLSDLRRIGIGVNEVEQFNLGLKMNFKSDRMKNGCEAEERKVVKVAMDLKIRDENFRRQELQREKNKLRRELAMKLGNNSRPFRRVMKYLNGEANKTKNVNMEKYREKIKHLRRKYKVEEEEKLDEVPTELENFSTLSVFNGEKFENIKCDEITITIVGDINVDEDEKAAMRLPPKFSMMQKLEKNGLAYEQEAAYAKLRMELRKERENEESNMSEHCHRKTIGRGGGDPEMGKATPDLNKEPTSEEEKKDTEDEEDAKSRQIYDPIEGVYDPRKRRVTDLDECDRVTLPKPLSVIDEANIEARRAIHTRVYNEYIEEFCDKNGEQKPNVTKSESEGIKKIQKRIKEKEIIYMKTDKSGKGCLASLEKYKDLGEEHITKDEKIDRAEVREIDMILNGH